MHSFGLPAPSLFFCLKPLRLDLDLDAFEDTVQNFSWVLAQLLLVLWFDPARQLDVAGARSADFLFFSHSLC